MSNTTVNTDAEAMASSLTTVQTAVAGFDKIAAGIAALHAAHPVNLVADASTKDGMAILTAGYKAYRTPRLALEQKRKEAKAPIVTLGRNVDAFAAVLEKQLRAGEDNYGGQIEAYKAEQARLAEEAKKKDDERKAKHQAALAVIRSYATMAAGLPSTRIANGITNLESMRFGAEWEEFASHAVIAQTETLVLLRQMLTQTQQAEAEAEAARIKQEAEDAAREEQRLENERVAAALKAQQDAIEAQKRELQRQQDELNAQRAAMAPPAAPAPAPVADDDVPAAVTAARATLQAALGAAPPPVAQEESPASPVAQSQPAAVLELRSADRRLATSGSSDRQANEEPTLKLGEIAAALGHGITMTEVFITEALKIKKPAQPAGAQGVLFLPSQLNEALEALAELALSKRR